MGDHFGPLKLVPFLAPTLVPFLVPNIQKIEFWGPKLGTNVVLDFQNSLCPTISIWTDVGTTPML